MTSDADRRIVEENQKGVNFRFCRRYSFGPMEKNACRYIEWEMRDDLD